MHCIAAYICLNSNTAAHPARRLPTAPTFTRQRISKKVQVGLDRRGHLLQGRRGHPRRSGSINSLYHSRRISLCHIRLSTACIVEHPRLLIWPFSTDSVSKKQPFSLRTAATWLLYRLYNKLLNKHKPTVDTWQLILRLPDSSALSHRIHQTCTLRSKPPTCQVVRLCQLCSISPVRLCINFRSHHCKIFCLLCNCMVSTHHRRLWDQQVPLHT